jgi:uncharacterized protein YcfL
MKTFVHTLIIMAALALGSVASEEGHVITGRIVKLNDQNITVQSGKERLQIEILTKDMFDVEGHAPTRMNVQPKVGDLVTVHYRKETTRFGGGLLWADQIQVKAANGRER